MLEEIMIRIDNKYCKLVNMVESQKGLGFLVNLGQRKSG